MAQHDSQPWNPDRRVDPFIALLLAVILLLVGGQFRARAARSRGAEAQVTLEGRIQDVVLGGTKAREWAARHGWQMPGAPETRTSPDSGWDQAVLAVHAAEAGDLDRGGRLIQRAPGATGEAFRRIWASCYLTSRSGPGPAASAAEVQAVQQALGHGYAARILEARLLARAGGDPRPLEAQAQAWATARQFALGAAGLGGTLLALAGFGFALFLAFVPVPPRPLPRFELSGRALLIVLLGWFLTLLVAAPAVAALIGFLPLLKPFYLPLVYGLHALAGLTYLCWAEGIGPGELRRRLAPGRAGAALASGLGFFALAFGAVAVVAMALGPFLRASDPPQKELLDMLSRPQSPWVVVLLFLTVAVAAPVFEEVLFRGLLLPWMGARLEPRLGLRRSRLLAIAATGAAFAAMHLQPMGLPTLTTLGIVLGFAFLRTGNLVTSILVHGIWNGGIFLAMRAMN
jgi:membrane protease YdiL (CAAX protease family)